MPIFNDRTGESKIMKNGLKATIINYRNCEDIDVEFENNEIAYNHKYSNFIRGKIKCPMKFEYIDNYVRVTNFNINPYIIFLIDKENIGLIKNSYCHLSKAGYINCYVHNYSQPIYLHRLITNQSSEMVVDHINGDKTDNRKSNLRLCLHADNMRNMKKSSSNTSGYKGVYWDKRKSKWCARVMVNYKHKHLGYFSLIDEAARAYNAAAIKYHGEFTRLNRIH